jgi:hypothetical protein
LIGECSINLKPLIEDVIETGKMMSLNKKYYKDYLEGVLKGTTLDFSDEDCFWISCIGKGDDKESEKLKNNGSIRVSITVVPKEM